MMSIGTSAIKVGLQQSVSSDTDDRLTDQMNVVRRWKAVARRLLRARNACVHLDELFADAQLVTTIADAGPERSSSILCVPVPPSQADWVTELCVSDEPGRVWSAGDFATICDVASALSLELGTVAERHDRARLQDRLCFSEEVHRALAEASSQIIWTCGPNGAVLDPSPSWQMFTGQSNEESLGFGWLDAVHPEDRRHLKLLWESVTSHPKTLILEYRLRHASGEWRWIAERAVPLITCGTILRGWAGMSVDVHQRKLDEEVRSASEARYRALVEASSQIVWTMNAKAIVSDASCEAWCAFTGQSADDWQQRRWLEAVHPDDRVRVTGLWNAAPSASNPIEYEYRLKHHSGDWHWMVERVVPLKNGTSNCSGWVGMTSDITHRKLTEIALAQSGARYRALVEASSQIVWTADAEGNAVEDSPSWRAFTGKTEVDRCGTGWINAIHPDDRSASRERWRAVVRDTQPSLAEYRLQNAAGEWRWISERSVPYGDTGGRPEGWVGMAVDITDRKQSELELAGRERHLSLALKAARMAAWSFDLDTAELTVEGEGDALIGMQGPGNRLERLMSRMASSDAERFKSLLAESVQTNASLQFDFCYSDGNAGKWIRASGQYEMAVAGQRGIVRGVFSDITERRQIEERRNLLVGEIAHRGKNLLAVVQSIAAVTLVGDQASQDVYKKFLQRLASLARSHSLLTDKDWTGVPLDEIVKLEFCNLTDRVSINVAPVVLNPSAAQNCALVIHELVTNAIKYGALSVPAGRVAVEAHLATGEEDDVVQFRWKETGGPTVRPPVRRGFGSMLLRRLIDGFDAPGTINYESDGLRVEIAMPLSMIRPADQSATLGRCSAHN